MGPLKIAIRALSQETRSPPGFSQADGLLSISSSRPATDGLPGRRDRADGVLRAG